MALNSFAGLGPEQFAIRMGDPSMGLTRHGYQLGVGVPAQQFSFLGNQHQALVQQQLMGQMPASGPALVYSPFPNGPSYMDAAAMGRQHNPQQRSYDQLFNMEGLRNTQVPEPREPGQGDASEEEDVPIGRGLKRPKALNPRLTEDGLEAVARKHLESRKRLKLIQDGLEGMEGLTVKPNGGLTVDLKETVEKKGTPDKKAKAKGKGSPDKQKGPKKERASKSADDSKDQTVENGTQGGPNEMLPPDVDEGAPPEKKKRKYVRKQKAVVATEVVPEVVPNEAPIGEERENKLGGSPEGGADKEENMPESIGRVAIAESDEKDLENLEVHEKVQGGELEQKAASSPAVGGAGVVEVATPAKKVAPKPAKKCNPLDDITEDCAGILDLGWGVQFLIPPFYDDLAPKLGLPTFDMTQIEENLLAGGMRSAHLAALVKEEAERRAARREELERAEIENIAAREGTGTPTPSAKGRVPDGQRCSVCRSVKKGGCGSANAHPRCRKRALDGFPFVMDEQDTPGAGGFANDGGVGISQGDPSFLARAAGALQILQSQKGVFSPEQISGGFTPEQLQGVLTPEQLQGVFTPEQLAMFGPGGVSLDALRRQAEAAASALAWQALPQGALQAGPAVRPQPPARNESPQAEPKSAAKNEKLRLTLKLAKDPVIKEKEDTARVKRLWQQLARRDIPKQHRAFTAAVKKQTGEAKRVAELCQREVKARCTRSQKLARLAGQRTRRLARDMVLFWKKMDRESAELKKQEEREAAAALRREEELREARRQQQRLNFLLTQTELYSHFMRSQGGPSCSQTAPLERSPSVEISQEEAEENRKLQEEAEAAAQAAAARTQDRTSAFDTEVHRLRNQTAEPPPDGSENIDLLNPSTMPEVSTVLQPKMFLGKLKEYQLKGVQWLVNLYEQGLNGILADEMGLGKTIQAMSFLGHLAEEKGIWGPFIVVSPASTLPNWVDELGRFCPELKVLPYWGGANERAVLRKNLNPKRLYRKDSAFHICVTSYQLIVADEKYLKKVKWQYMVLDEAQAIKSSSSQRWKSMLSFNCRNRMLLTGTPIQNNMAELWALLHFIMPTLFDNHEQFNEWFSKGIEGHAEGVAQLNEHQLTRLHAILKPFMLRRVKKDVESEMTGKKEVTISCPLSGRQQALYRAIKNNISIADLFDGGSSDKQMLRLMNIVIQLRKVCNHPELFERNEARLSYTFCVPPLPLQPAPFGELDWIAYPGCRNPIAFQIPKLLYREATPCLPPSASGTPPEARSKWLHKQLSIFSPDNIHRSIFPPSSETPSSSGFGGCFGFTRLLGLSPQEVSFLVRATVLERWVFYQLRDAARVRRREIDEALREGQEDPRTRCVINLLNLPLRGASPVLLTPRQTGPPSQPFQTLVTPLSHRLLDNARLLRSVADIIPPVQAPPIDSFCPDRSYAYQQKQLLYEPWVLRTLSGRARVSDNEGPVSPAGSLPGFAEQQEGTPLMAPLMRAFGASLPMQAMDFSKMLTDSGKLQQLDALLRRLRREGHRVLIFAQMTSMMNILEDYLNFRKFKYLRLDGSSSIVDRRDMVNDFQTRSDIFVFLLSTRAGGLGINLTAADTVIFYESDWNPTMDLQAMDRAHRLGQTKEVTVYRMICSGTVEEKIVKRASQKSTVQQLVMTGGQAQPDVFQPEEVMSLLLDDAELEKQLKAQGGKQPAGSQKKRKSGGARAIRMLDNGSDVAVADSGDGPHENTPGTSGGKGDVTSVGGDVTSPPEGGGRKRKKAERPSAPKPPKVPKARSRGGAQKKGSSLVKEGMAAFVEAPSEGPSSLPGSDSIAPPPLVGKVERTSSAAVRLKIRPPSASGPGGGSDGLPVSPDRTQRGEDEGAVELLVCSPLVKPHAKKQRSKKRHKGRA